MELKPIVEAFKSALFFDPGNPLTIAGAIRRDSFVS